MKMLRLAAVSMLATAVTLACSDDDDGSPSAAAGSSAEGGAEPESAGAGTGGAKGAAPACENQFDSAEGGEATGGAAQAPLEIHGHYVDNFGFDVDVSATLWNGSGIIEYDNDANVVYTQNACDDDFNPNKFAKIVYTEPEAGSFYYCMIEYSAESLDAAKVSEKMADPNALDTDGCAGFAWSKATSE